EHDCTDTLWIGVARQLALRTQDVLTRCRVGLAGLSLASADTVLEISLCGHRAVLQPRDRSPHPRSRGLKTRDEPTGGVRSPLPLSRLPWGEIRWGSASSLRRVV